MENEIKVSVIIPAYNIEKYIEECIDSVLKQKLVGIEIIIINDGSTDKTQKILENKYKKNDNIVIVNKKNNEGLSQARNTGIAMARGKYIYHLDGDDWLEENALKEMYEYCEENDLDMVICDFYTEYPQKRIYTKDITPVKSIEEYREKVFEMNVKWNIWNKLIKKKLYNKIKFIPGILMGEDFAVILRMAYEVKKIGKIDKAYIHYRKHNESLTKQNQAKYLDGYFKIYTELENYLKERKIYEQEKDNIYKLQLNHFKKIVFEDSDWSNQDYISGIEKYLKIIKDERFFKFIKNIPIKWRYLNYFIRVFPTKKTMKILTKLKVLKKFKVILCEKRSYN